ncbi:MAG TPA: 50S ribosomal protein L21 [Patescibacteria group bacterium]|nr:50S ribosomal protein L21 [Patescibacteria group bacterium]
MKYAVVSTGGKQYKVAEGEVLEVERLDVEPESTYTFPQVLLIVDGETRTIGAPFVEEAIVSAKVLSQEKGDKIRVAKFKAKARYRNVRGFRAQITKLQIEKITSKKEKAK